MCAGKKHRKKHGNRARKNKAKELLRLHYYLGETHEDRQLFYPELMAERHGAVIVRCPACGGLSRVPCTSRKRWKCPCTPKQSRFVHEDLLKGRKNIILERTGTDSDGSGLPRLAYCNMPERVTIKGYDTIRAGAFRNCNRLQSVQLGDEVSYIGSDAFSGCRALEQIDLPDSLTAIGESAFHSSGLRRISLPDSLQYIGDGAFAECSNLTELNAFETADQEICRHIRRILAERDASVIE